ncbi:Hypothetical_protein [Hexamita inflata]|uniref:Hypothetical_protein n=1 Tax=Hexamita inflata TaxID=28002 RepID=A0AA86QW88_9EUKA|nr:Hypothetical protein HINF_LOCUS48518 [Hexamita inflata]
MNSIRHLQIQAQIQQQKPLQQTEMNLNQQILLYKIITSQQIEDLRNVILQDIKDALSMYDVINILVALVFSEQINYYQDELKLQLRILSALEYKNIPRKILKATQNLVEALQQTEYNENQDLKQIREKIKLVEYRIRGFYL